MTDMQGSQSGPHPDQRQHVHEELIAKIDSVPLPLPDGASAVTPQIPESAEYRASFPQITTTLPHTTETTSTTRYGTSGVVLPRITTSTRYVRSDGGLPAETTTTVVPETSTTAETAHPTRYVKAGVVLPRITTSTRYEASGETPQQTK